MADALLRGIATSGQLRARETIVAEPVEERRNWFAQSYGVHTTASNAQALRAADRVLLAVKPQQFQSAVKDMGDIRRQGKLFVSIMAGVPLATLQALLGEGARCVRAMPNTPALALAGATAVHFDDHTGPGDRQWTLRLFETAGRVVVVDKESQMDAVTGLSGSGPAYVFEMIEALADGGVHEGLSRATALELAIQTVLGAAQLARLTGEHPAALKDKVASPGGTTIAGLRELEAAGFRSALIEAVIAAADRSRELSGQ